MEEKKGIKKVSLEDLINEKSNKAKKSAEASKTKKEEKFVPLSIEDIKGPIKKEIPLHKQAENDLFADLDSAIERTKEDLKPIIAKGKEILIENQLKKEEAKESENDAPVSLNDDETDDEEDDDIKDNIVYDKDIIKEEESEEDDIDEKDITETEETPVAITAEAPVVKEVPAATDKEEESKETKKKNTNIIYEDKEDTEDEDDEDDMTKKDELSEDKKKEILDEFKVQVKKSITPVKNKIDLTKFTIKSKAVNISKVLGSNADVRHISDWVLPNTNRSISVSELSGVEIEKLNAVPGNRNRINSLKARFSVIYDHIVDPNKPKSLEEWSKTISFFDIPHLYFAVYKACFENSNFVPYVCPEKKCSNTFLVKTEIKDMVKYDNDEVKAKVAKLFEKDTTSPGALYQAELFQASNEYVVALKPPSIYNVIFENSILDEAFTNKYAELLGVISFIDAIYTIDKANNELIPIDTAPIPNDLLKSVKRKVRDYSRILSRLKSDEYVALKEATDKLTIDKSTGMSYIIPGAECPKCKAKIESYEQEPLAMVFTRHRLTTIANS